MGMMDRVRDWLSPSRTRSGKPPSVRSDFMRGNRGVVFGGWRPALREAADDVGASWDLAVARTIDLIQNSGWMSGAIDQAVANTVGTGLRLKAMPENDLFGMSNAEAESWAQTVEQRWSLWAATAGNSSTQLATTAFVAAAVAAVVNGSPGALDTLNELAAALGNDANFSATVTNALAGKLVKASNLSDLTDTAAARTNLGLGTMATQNAGAVAITGGSMDGITLDGGTF